MAVPDRSVSGLKILLPGPSVFGVSWLDLPRTDPAVRLPVGVFTHVGDSELDGFRR